MNKNLKALAIALSIGGVFVAGVAVGKETKTAKYIAREEVKMTELQPGGMKVGPLTGDSTKGPHMSLIWLPGGFESPWHSHSGDYEAIQIAGSSRHWVKGEEGAKAKKMTPGSYWMMPGMVDHVSACDKGADCLVAVWQKTKFDAIPGKDAKAPPPAKPSAPPPPPAKKM